MVKWLYEFLGKACAVVGAAIGVQMPMFMQQYTQQLAGRAAELQLHIDSVSKSAGLNGRSLTQYIQKFLESTDNDFAAQGHLLKGMVERFYALSDALLSFQSASVLSKPYLFFVHFDTEIAKNTWQYFQLGIPLTLEGLSYALSGMLLSGFLFSAISMLMIYLMRQYKALRPHNEKLGQQQYGKHV